MGGEPRATRDEPDWLGFTGWQGGDEAHPVGTGEPAYRIVYKTLRVAVERARFEWPNLRIICGHGTIKRGGVTLPGALPARVPGKWVLPEFGRLVPKGTAFGYEPTRVEDFVFQAWEDELDDLFFVEFILKTEATTASAQIDEGRNRLAEMKTMFDLRFGPRLLGGLVAEEAGEVFGDWHFNRAIASDQVGHEFQLDVIGISAQEMVDWQTSDMARYNDLSLTEKHRVRLGCQWFWLAIHERDPVTQYLALWFVLEVLAMPDTTNVKPIRELLAAKVGRNENDWSEFVGRHFGRRSKLVHGNGERAVATDELASLRTLVEVVLSIDLSTLDVARAHALLAHAGLVQPS